MGRNKLTNELGIEGWK